MRRRGVAVAACVVATLTSACASRRTRECKQVKAAISEAFPASSGSAAPLAPGDVAKRYDQLASRLRALHAGDPELAPALDAYVKNADSAARAARELAKATKSRDPKRIAGARPDVERVARREDKIAGRIERICSTSQAASP